jgi:hypothetical protein
MRGVNLIPTARLQAQRLRRRLRVWMLALIGWTGLVLAACAGARVMLGQDRAAAVADELVKTQAQVVQVRAQSSQVARQLAEADATRRSAEALVDQPDWSILMSGVAALTGDDLMLREFTLTPAGETRARAGTSAGSGAQPTTRPARYELRLRGLGRQQQAVGQFVVRLQQLGLFDEVRLARSGREPLGNGSVIGFEITCTLGEAAGGAP